jgi:biopolymer transport protein ExbB
MKLLARVSGILLLTPLMAFAQEAAQAVPSAATNKPLNVWELILSTDWILIPLGIVSLGVVGLIIFNLFWLKINRIYSEEFLDDANRYLKEGDLKSLLKTADAYPNQGCAQILEKVISSAKENPYLDLESLQKIAEAEGNRFVLKLNQPTTLLMDLGVIAPMIGLLGTVVGILRAFGNLADDVTPMRTVLLAGGVSQALVATAIGLVIGMLAMFFYAIYRSRVNYLIGQFETVITPLMVKTISHLGRGNK